MQSAGTRVRKSPASLSALLASTALARLVTHFVLFPASAPHFQALRRATALSTRSLQHELARLGDHGLITREVHGSRVHYCAVTTDSRWRTLKSLVREFADPGEVLRVALADASGIKGAFLYGSYARKADVHAASDVDLFLIVSGVEEESDRITLASRMLHAAGLIGREINISSYTSEMLTVRLARGGRFLRSVLAGPKEWLVGSDTALTDDSHTRDQ